jgi:hypothetical protein
VVAVAVAVAAAVEEVVAVAVVPLVVVVLAVVGESMRWNLFPVIPCQQEVQVTTAGASDAGAHRQARRHRR